MISPAPDLHHGLHPVPDHLKAEKRARSSLLYCWSDWKPAGVTVLRSFSHFGGKIVINIRPCNAQSAGASGGNFPHTRFDLGKPYAETHFFSFNISLLVKM